LWSARLLSILLFVVLSSWSTTLLDGPGSERYNLEERLPGKRRRLRKSPELQTHTNWGQWNQRRTLYLHGHGLLLAERINAVPPDSLTRPHAPRGARPPGPARAGAGQGPSLADSYTDSASVARGDTSRSKAKIHPLPRQHECCRGAGTPRSPAQRRSRLLGLTRSRTRAAGVTGLQAVTARPAEPPLHQGLPLPCKPQQVRQKPARTSSDTQRPTPTNCAQPVQTTRRSPSSVEPDLIPLFTASFVIWFY